ncbi:ShlB/FhaC/HecB family hemolysin secretion/activation protein [Photorhabdus luminescens]|uniref:ShlB/FhaC/HecB family hemolysin secretion/activation protein n=1 Tax=Photorhabdus luminescens subsp. sonorensis TaxID=1173677 RepID=A0A5C4RE43_PHOLU|nr:ShlB/FhaC/HecB family hemolysin secretion/activation protein [Photorhabdus luminescens]TNH42226.1 ShlB/FhaC/HecB family hemolysin secretion/activation protein [Photorhabdus luminescens subsp. sonorensis]
MVTSDKIIAGLAGWAVFAISPVQADDQPFIHQKQQQQAQEQRLEAKAPTVRLSDDTASVSRLVFPKESPCFVIHKVGLSGRETLPHWLPLQRLADLANGRCLGTQGISLLMSNMQNRLIYHGWVTTRVLAPEQNLSQSELKLNVVPGMVRHIRYADDADKYATLYTAIPAREGGLLDLRDIEQGLENLQRLPNVQASMELVPGEQPGESDIVIKRQQSRFWHIGAWVDNSGTKATGRTQGGLMFALDNPTSLSDLLYITMTRDLVFSNQKDSTNYTAHYSVPFGYWQFAVTSSKYTYAQTIPHHNEDAKYRGRSQNLNAQLSRVLHRNAGSKTTLTYGVNARQTRNFIKQTEIDAQKRRTSSWSLGLAHRHYIGPAVLDAGGRYQKGTRWFGALPAFEERRDKSSPDYATAKSEIIQFSASLNTPFTLANEKFWHLIEYQRQWSNTPLTPQDQFSIGNRWTVRGFDGERTLSADEGWTLRNTLSWQTPLPEQQLYLGADYGRVGGNGSDMIIGRTLAGGVIGLKGNIRPANLAYDVSVGTPLSKPDGFKTDSAYVGFSLNWQY